MSGISAVVGIGSSTSANGQILFEIPGTYAWTAPSKVTSVSVVCVGAGGGSRVGYGQTNSGSIAGSGGGALAYKNNIPILPGGVYTVVVGAAGINDTINSRIATNGGNSYFISNTLVFAGGGQVGNSLEQYVVSGGEYIGDGGGNGGNGVSAGAYRRNGGGGGGAGGYTAPGGPGGGSSPGSGDGENGLASAGGGGGGGAFAPSGYYSAGGSGGGVGVLGLSANGFGGILQYTGPYTPDGSPRNVLVGGGAGGSHGANSSVSLGGVAFSGTYSGGTAGYYGGGAGGTFSTGEGTLNTSYAGGGAVRIIWPGDTRQFPNTFTHDLYY